MKRKIIFSVIGVGILSSTFALSTLNSNENHNINIHQTSAKEKNVANIKNVISQEQVQKLMLNSIDHFKYAQGSFIYYSDSANFNLLVNYATDLSDNPKSYEKVEQINSDNLLSEAKALKLKALNNNSPFEEFVYDGDSIIVNRVDNKRSTKSLSNDSKVHKEKVAAVSNKQRKNLANTSMEERVTTEDGEKVYSRRIDPSYMGVAKTSLFPEDIAMRFLASKKSWKVTGVKEVNGRNAVVVEGTLNKDYKQKYSANKFYLEVDQKTGILLKMQAIDNKGVVKEAIETQDITIDKNIPDSQYQITE